jgi:hypothetical protein
MDWKELVLDRKPGTSLLDDMVLKAEVTEEKEEYNQWRIKHSWAQWRSRVLITNIKYYI